MFNEDILNFIEDKDVEERSNWYFHATMVDIKKLGKF